MFRKQDTSKGRCSRRSTRPWQTGQKYVDRPDFTILSIGVPHRRHAESLHGRTHRAPRCCRRCNATRRRARSTVATDRRKPSPAMPSKIDWLRADRFALARVIRRRKCSRAQPRAFDRAGRTLSYHAAPRARVPTVRPSTPCRTHRDRAPDRVAHPPDAARSCRVPRESTKVKARTIGKLEHGTRKAWKLVGRHSDLPIAVQSKMHVKHASVGEMQQLMLAASLHSLDLRAGQRPHARRGESPAQRRMKKAYSSNGSSLRSAAKHTHRGFDFR